ncbi:hypothetical protein ACMZ8B_05150 [Gardnerella greenwoodii]|uniref:hypothetical protein n=1 Tax=Gardnerella greenwoodii TaxID=2914925 RepID=UPI0039EE5642
MSDLHRNSRFLRFLRSICAKTAYARRAIVALFVVAATILATFMIMPSASMGASSQNESNHEQTQSQTKSENVEPKTEQDVNTAESKADAKGGASASGENGESKPADPKAVDPKDPQTSSKQDGSSAASAQSVDSTKQQQNNGVEGVNNNLNKGAATAKDAAKDAEKSKSANNALRRQKRELGNTRAAASSVPLPAECKKVGSLAKCYKVKYEPHFSDSGKISGKISVRGQELPAVEPIFKPVEKEFKSKKVNYKEFVTGFVLEKLMVSKSEEAKNNGLVTLNTNTGKITVYANKWLKDSNYYAYVKVMYSDGSYTTNFDCPTGDTKCVKVTRPQVRLSFSVARIEGAKGDLSLKVYNHQDSKGRSEVQDTNGVTFTSDDKGNFSPITPIFIDTTSTKKPNPIYHRMICHRDDQRPEIGYTLNNVDGLKLRNTNDATLLEEDDESAEGYTFQKQWDHALGERPGEESAKPYTVHESDLFTERSQSWITGTPNETGDFTCRVFAFNDADFTLNKISVGSYVKLFKLNTENLDDSKLRSIFENPVKAFYADAENGYKDKQKTIDWDVKTLKIKVNKKDKSKEKLSLKVYPFDEAGNNAIDATDTLVPIANDSTISLMKGVELRPLVEATYNGSTYSSKGDIGINLSMYCSKGQPDSSTKKLEYKNWMNSAPFTFPDLDNSTSTNGRRKRFFDSTTAPCNAHDGTSDCTTMTDSYAIFKPTEAGDYKCIVYAYKDDIKAPTIVQPDGTLKAITPDDMEKALFDQRKTKDVDYAKLTFKIYVPETSDLLPKTGGHSWNLQLGAVAAVMVSVLAAGFVISQSEACRKLLYKRRRC